MPTRIVAGIVIVAGTSFFTAPAIAEEPSIDADGMDALIGQLQSVTEQLNIGPDYAEAIRKAMVPPPPPVPPPEKPSPITPTRIVAPQPILAEAPPPSQPLPLNTTVALREDFAVRTTGLPVELMIGPSDRTASAVLHLLCRGATAQISVQFEGQWMPVGRADMVTTTFGEGVFLKDVKRDGRHLVWVFGQILDANEVLNIYVRRQDRWRHTHSLRRDDS